MRKMADDILLERVRGLIASDHRSHTAIAIELGVTKQALSRWMHGKSGPCVKARKRIADMYGVSVGWLYGCTENELGKNFGENLKRMMAVRGIGQEDMANALHVSIATISAWRNGIRTPKQRHLEEIADYLRVTVGDLADDTTVYITEKRVREVLSKYLTDEVTEQMIRAIREYKE